VAEGISLALDKNLDMVSKCIPVIMKARAYQAMGHSNFTFEPDSSNDVCKSATGQTKFKPSPKPGVPAAAAAAAAGGGGGGAAK